VRTGNVSQTKRNYTGQILDGTGLLYYNARYYDPAIGRFISADTVVPGNASGGMEGVAVKPLTVGFHETQFLGKLNGENKLGFWFQLDDRARQRAGEPWGPANPQALNRYSYVLNNPLKYTDPSGHVFAPPQVDISGWPRWAQQAVRAACVALGCSVSSSGIVTAAPDIIGPPIAASGQRAFAAGRWLSHFQKHMDQFNYKTAVEYLRGAQTLTGGIKGTFKFIRSNGDTLFYNPATNEFAVLASDGRTIRTYFKPEDGIAYWQHMTGGNWQVIQ
jgi:RHS repeat-associated protein